MQIKVWSDFVCPFCYIGDTHLQEALNNFEHADKVTIEYKSYILSPDATRLPGESYQETFVREKNIDISQVENMLKQVDHMASAAGLNLDFSIAKMANTNKAHQIFQYAKSENYGREFFQRLFRAHFEEGLDLNSLADLQELVKELGLESDIVKDIYNSEQYQSDVEQDIAESRSIGVQGVPFFVFNNKYAVSGAQPVDTFEQVLNDIWSSSIDKK